MNNFTSGSSLLFLALTILAGSSQAETSGVVSAFSINDVSLVEGTGGASTLSFTVSVLPAPAANTQVSFATSAGTANAGSDFTSQVGVLTFTPMTTSQTINVSLSTDITVEADESFSVTLSNPTNGAVLDDALGIGTILNDDQTTVSIGDVAVDEGDAGVTTMSFLVQMSNPVQGGLGVAFQSADGNDGNATLNATVADNDYSAAVGQISFASGSLTPQFVNIDVNGDNKVEPDQGLRLVLGPAVLPSGVDSADVILPGSANGLIQDDDGTVISVADASVTEGDAAGVTLDFTVSLSNPSKTPVSVQYQTSSGSAIAGLDFSTSSGTLIIPALAVDATISVPVLSETQVEANEGLSLTLSQPVGGFLGDNEALGQINNDDSATVTVSSPAVAEGNGGNTPLQFQLTLSDPVQGTVALTVDTADGNDANPFNNATLADNDYVAVTSQAVSFAPGSSQANVSVNVIGDLDVEPNQQLRLLLGNLTANGVPAGTVTIASATATGIALNDDGSNLTIADASVVEGSGTNSTLSFILSLSAPSKSPVDVSYQTVAQSADSGTDFVAASGIVTIPANSLNASVSVSVIGDSIVESAETLLVQLSNANGITLLDAEATGTINNDDSTQLRLEDGSAVEPNVGNAPLVLTARLSNPVQGLVTADFQSADGTATNGLDYTAVSGQVTFAPLATSATIIVPMVGDTGTEGTETVIVTLSNVQPAPPDVVLADAIGTGLIVDNDTPLTIPLAGRTTLFFLAMSLFGLALLRLRRL